MRYERIIAQRYLGSRRQMRFINIIMYISVVGITVGVAALLVVLSVFNGFNSVVTQVLVGFDPHIKVTPAQGKSLRLTDEPLNVLNQDPRIAAWAPFIANKALLMTPQFNRVVLIKGVVDSAIGNVSGVKDRIVLGSLSFQDTREAAGIVLGLTLADRLAATVGTELTLVSPMGVDAMMMQFGQPLMRKCKVVGIYDSNNKDYDAHYAFVSLDEARKLFEYKDGVSGIELRLHRIDDADDVKSSLQRQLGSNFSVATWYDLHKDLYSVMNIERWVAYIILCLIVGVATFNVLGSLTMGVIEKRRDVGVLKSLGATRRSIIRVFMFEGILVGTIGTVLGLVIGFGVCYLQMKYQLFPLDPNVYIIPAIPIEVRWTDFLAVSGAAMVLSMFASLYPALRAARLQPVEAIRWE